MKAYIVKKYVLVHDWAPHPVYGTVQASPAYPPSGQRYGRVNLSSLR